MSDGTCDKCSADRACPCCGRSHDVAGIGHDINGDDFHVHCCPWCGVDFSAYLCGVKELLGE